MRTTGEDVGRRVKVLVAVCAVAVLAARTQAQGSDGSGDPCTITNGSAPFSIVTLVPVGDYNILSWQTCTDHIYIVQSESSLTPTSSWTDVAWTFGLDQTTSWIDSGAIGQTQNFYRVVRASVLSLTLRYNESLHFDQMDIGKAFQ